MITGRGLSRDSARFPVTAESSTGSSGIGDIQARDDEADYLQLSGIQHYAFCARQWGLIHLEGQWQDNLLTFQGAVLHRRVDNGKQVESRPGILTCRSIPLASRQLRMSGRADVLEFLYCGQLAQEDTLVLVGREGFWRPCPVEYKRGRPKAGDWDAVQVCAQALCLEEMLGVDIREGAIYYGRTRRRQVVALDEGLRSRVFALTKEMHQLADSGRTPSPPKRAKGCLRCSLKDVCVPRIRRTKRVTRYVSALLSDAKDDMNHAEAAEYPLRDGC